MSIIGMLREGRIPTGQKSVLQKMSRGEFSVSFPLFDAAI